MRRNSIRKYGWRLTNRQYSEVWSLPCDLCSSVRTTHLVYLHASNEPDIHTGTTETQVVLSFFLDEDNDSNLALSVHYCKSNILVWSMWIPFLYFCIFNFVKTLLVHFRCAIPGWPGDTYEVQSSEHQDAINTTIPVELVDGEPTFSSCLIFVNLSASLEVNANMSYSTVACTDWVYDKSVFEFTAVSQVILF